MATIKGPDFTKSKRDVLLVTIPDGEGGGVELALKPPTKRAYDALASLAKSIADILEGEAAADDFDMSAAIGLVAQIMENNTAYRKVDAEDLMDMGLDEIGEFVAAYMTFIAHLVESKNSPFLGIPATRTEE